MTPREPSEAEIEAAARALYLAHNGSNPDWPIGLDHYGYHQEPYIRSVPAWKWLWKKPTATIVGGGVGEDERRNEGVATVAESTVLNQPLPRAEAAALW